MLKLSSLYFQMSLARQSIQVSVRWAAFSPLANLGATEHTLQLLGGPGPNADNTFMFHIESPETIGSSSSLTALKGGTVSFSFYHSQKVRECGVFREDGLGVFRI